MAIRTAIFHVYEDMTVFPTTPLYGGVQGEHNATEVIFVINTDSPLVNPDYKYYIECIDATGNYDRTQQLYRFGNELRTLVPLAWTQYGGTATVRLLAEENQSILYTVEGRIQFADRGSAIEQVDGLLRTDIGQMMEAAETTLNAATTAADQAAASASAAAADADACDAAVADAIALGDTLRADVDALESRLVTVDEALDGVIAIQNDMIGGESA